MGYDEINLNVGCPSDRVQSGRFGACLMREPELVAECMAAIRGAVDVPATVKCRIGVDDQDPEVSLFATVDASRGRGRHDLHRPCAQGLAEGAVAQGEPGRAAAGLCAGAPAEAGAAASDHLHQRRHRVAGRGGGASGRQRRGPAGRGHAGARRLSRAGPAGSGGPAAVRGGGRRRRSVRGDRAVQALSGGAAGGGLGPACHDAAHAGR